jgi:hypothetical protein
MPIVIMILYNNNNNNNNNNKQHTKKARNQGTAENNIVHGTPSSESTNVTVQIFNVGTSVIFTFTVNSNYRIAATLYSLGA